jgi:hypothetical protein
MLMSTYLSLYGSLFFFNQNMVCIFRSFEHVSKVLKYYGQRENCSLLIQLKLASLVILSYRTLQILQSFRSSYLAHVLQTICKRL